MTLKRYRIPKQEHGSQEWLNDRFRDKDGNKRVSASAVAAIYGLHPFVPMEKYAAELLGDTPPKPIPPNPAMERGNRLEPFVLEWACDKLGIKYDTPEEMFACDTKGGARMIATLDGFYEHGDERKVLEIKTSTREWTGVLPDYWRLQGIQQAICADVHEVTWAVFDPKMILHLHVQEVTSDEVVEHIAAVEKWLNAIDLGITPSGVRWSYETITTRYQKPTEESVELDRTASDLIAQLKHVKSELKSYKDLEDKLKAELCDLIGNAEVATINGVTVATWKGQTRHTFDSKTFQAEHPDIASKYTRQSVTRTLLLKGER